MKLIVVHLKGTRMSRGKIVAGREIFLCSFHLQNEEEISVRKSLGESATHTPVLEASFRVTVN